MVPLTTDSAFPAPERVISGGQRAAARAAGPRLNLPATASLVISQVAEAGRPVAVPGPYETLWPCLISPLTVVQPMGIWPCLAARGGPRLPGAGLGSWSSTRSSA